MYKIVMVSPLGYVKHDYQTGFESELHALSVADDLGWVYVDDNRFEWLLDVEEEVSEHGNA